MLFLIHRSSPIWLGTPLLLLGVLGLTNAVVQRSRSRRENDHGLRSMAGKFNMPIACLFALATSGTGMLFKIDQIFFVMMAVVILLLISAYQNAWQLLVQTNMDAIGKIPKH